MRIALLSQNARPWGGIERCVQDLAAGLSARGHTLALAHADPRAEGAFLAPFAASACLAGAPAGEAAARVLALRPDVLYVHKWEQPELVAALSPRLPVVTMVHDHDLTCPRRHRYTLFGRRDCDRPMGAGCLRCLPFVERAPGGRAPRWRPLGARLGWLRLLRSLPHLVVASEAMAASLVRNGVPRGRVTVLPPVPRDPVPEQPPPYAPEGPLLFVGQLIRTKGWDLLLDAYGRLAAPPPLVLAGGGNDLRRAQRAVAGHRWRERIDLRGQVAPEELTALYRQASVVAVPSRWQEPFGLVGLEAMAQARPVVAFAVGGIPSWLEHERTGLLVPPGDARAFAAALEALLRDPARGAAMGRAAHAARLDRFDAERALDGVEALLRRAARRRRLEVIA